MGESIVINNTSASALDFHFFQYSDFDLGGTTGGQTVQLGKNLSGLFNEALQTAPGVAFTETVLTPGANHGEAGLFNTTLVKLNDGTPTTLNDNAGPVGPGDATWAFEWDLSIAPGSSALISKDKYIQLQPIPEPSSLALISLGLAGWLIKRRRSK